jgi:hypothetical protein
MKIQCNQRIRSGSTALETLMVLGSFVLATYVFLNLAQQVIKIFVQDGNTLSDVPLF